MRLGISLGLSFLEASVLAENGKPVVQKLTYLPGQTLETTIQSLLSQSPVKISEILITSRILERILATKLGGSVAQVVTQGLEDWLFLRQPADSLHFKLNPSRSDPLASQELVFGVDERIGADGQILKPLKIEELEFISAKLKMMEIQKICLQFLHSKTQPVHLNQAKKFFLEKGFQVFACSHLINEKDEILSWRKNALNACLAGTFREVKEQITKGAADLLPADKINYIGGAGQIIRDELDLLTDTLFGFVHSLAKASQGIGLHLGREKWVLFDANQKVDFWHSPWGPVSVSAPLHAQLSVQPSSEILVNNWGEISPSKIEIGFEPGPISFGRSFHLCVFDLFANELKDLFGSCLSQNGPLRVNESLAALLKSSKSTGKWTTDRVAVELKKDLIKSIGVETQFFASAHKQISVSGIFAPLFMKELKSTFSNYEWILAPDAIWHESRILSEGKFL